MRKRINKAMQFAITAPFVLSMVYIFNIIELLKGILTAIVAPIVVPVVYIISIIDLLRGK